jgi:hypothetical protein
LVGLGNFRVGLRHGRQDGIPGDRICRVQDTERHETRWDWKTDKRTGSNCLEEREKTGGHGRKGGREGGKGIDWEGKGNGKGKGGWEGGKGKRKKEKGKSSFDTRCLHS